MDRAFRADEHIRRRVEYQGVYDKGRKISGRLMTVFTRQTDRTTPRLGIAATRKMGGAVERNRAKRLIREIFRHNKPSGGLDVVVVPRREMLDVSYVRLEAEFLALLGGRSSAGPPHPTAHNARGGGPGPRRQGRPRPHSSV